MNDRRPSAPLLRTTISLVAGPLGLLLALATAAQPAAAPARPAPPNRPAQPAPAAAPARPARTTPAAEPAAETPRPTTLPLAAQAILSTNPQTPAECLRAAQILADVEQPRLARQYLKRILDAKPDAAALAELADRFGAALFVRLGAQADLQPEAKALTDVVLAAANQRFQDEQRIGEWIKQLTAPQENTRYAALQSLTRARGLAVGPLLDVLADPARASEHDAARTAIVALGGDAVGPLLAVVEGADSALAVAAIRGLGDLRAREAVPLLLRPYLASDSDRAVRDAAGAALQAIIGQRPTQHDAVALLTSEAQKYFDRQPPFPGEVAGQATRWSWDAAKKRPVSHLESADVVRRAIAARCAADAYALAADDAAVRTLYLTTLLEQAAYANGLDKPLAADAAALKPAVAAGPAALEEVLAFAMAKRHPVPATAAARLLGQIGKETELLRQGAATTPLAAALQFPDRRLRMAAVAAIVKLKPSRPFVGSSQVVPVLSYFAASQCKPRALLAGPVTADLRETAGVLAARGYLIDTVVVGRDAVRKLAASPDYELALLDVQIDEPTVDFVLQQLRRDPRSAELRVGLLARDGYYERAEKVARHDGRALAFYFPHDTASIQWQLAQLTALAPDEFVPQPVRQQEAVEAIQMLGELAESSRGLFDVRRSEATVLAALSVPELAAAAIPVAGRLGTPAGQRALVELVSSLTAAVELRKAAAQAFAASVRGHGLLLTTEEIRRQYDRYNQSAALDIGTQQLLASVLNAIEAPTQGAKKRPAGKD